MCFIANYDNLTKVNPEHYLDDDELTMDELANVFEGLQKIYEISKVQNKKLRKENDFLQNVLDIALKGKENLSTCFEKVKKDFESHEIVCQGKNP